MVASGLQPPSGREWEIFRQVKIEAQVVGDVADMLDISSYRVSAAVARVSRFLVESAPVGESDEQRARRICHAEQIAAERVTFLYMQAIESFRMSAEEQTIVREIEQSGQPRRILTTRLTRPGDPKYLHVASRLAVLAAKLAAAAINDCREWDEREAAAQDAQAQQQVELHRMAGGKGYEVREVGSEARDAGGERREDRGAGVGKNSPVGACSVSGDATSVLPPKRKKVSDPTNDSLMSCVDEILAKQAPETRHAAPVHEPRMGGKQLSGKQARARQKFLANP